MMRSFIQDMPTFLLGATVFVIGYWVYIVFVAPIIVLQALGLVAVCFLLGWGTKFLMKLRG